MKGIALNTLPRQKWWLVHEKFQAWDQALSVWMAAQQATAGQLNGGVGARIFFAREQNALRKVRVAVVGVHRERHRKFAPRRAVSRP